MGDATWGRGPRKREAAAALVRGRRGDERRSFLMADYRAVLVSDDSDTSHTTAWLARGSGAKCVALPARKLSLPHGEFSWRWTPHPFSRV